jgi:hypothetical protein
MLRVEGTALDLTVLGYENGSPVDGNPPAEVAVEFYALALQSVKIARRFVCHGVGVVQMG